MPALVISAGYIALSLSCVLVLEMQGLQGPETLLLEPLSSTRYAAAIAGGLVAMLTETVAYVQLAVGAALLGLLGFVLLVRKNTAPFFRFQSSSCSSGIFLILIWRQHRASTI